MNAVNVLGITAGSSMQARACPANAVSALGMTLTAPPHLLQASISILNTRLKRVRFTLGLGISAASFAMKY